MIRRAGVMVGLAAAGAWLIVLGRGALSGPPSWVPLSITTWWARSPVVHSVALMRALALLVAVYLCALALFGFVLELARFRIPLPPLPGSRWLVGGALGLGLAAAASAAPAAARPSPAVDVPVLHRVAESSASVTPPVTSALDATAPHGVTPGAPTDQLEPVQPNQNGPRRWRVQPGDSLWSISRSALQQAWGRAVRDQEVGPYWIQLIGANRPILDNPDLIYPGMVLIVPGPPPAP
jgi:hypothetical protein